MSKLIYVIEDDWGLSEVMAEILRDLDAVVEVIRHGRDALDKLAQSTPHVVYLDMHLPEVSGMELLQFIRGAAHLADTRVAVMTADVLRGQSLEEMADVLLFKPVSMHDILAFGERFL